MVNEMEVLTVYDIMNILCICRNTAYNLLGSGQIKGFKIGRTWRITQKALDEYLDKKYK